MNEWRETTLAQLGRLVTGQTPASNVPEYFGDDVPFVTPSDFDGRRVITSTARYLTEEGANAAGRSRIPADAVMVSCIGSDMGKAAIAGRECVTNQQINSIIVDAGDDPLFVYYDLSVRKAEIRASAGGSAQPILNKSAFGQLAIRLPPLPEQRAIAGVLDALDDKIEQNRRTARALERLVRAIFRAWFVDFEPVKAKAEGSTAFPGMPQPVFDALPTSFVDSAIGPVPEEWEVAPLAELAEVRGGKQLPSEDCNTVGPFPVYGANGRMGYTDRPTHEGFVIAFGRVGAYCGSLHWTYGGAWINNNASSVVPRNWPEFVLQVLLEADFERMRRGSAQPFVPNSSLSALEAVVPTDGVLTSFSDVARSLRLEENALIEESRKLAEMRDYLLPKLLSGQVRVRKAQAHLDAAT